MLKEALGRILEGKNEKEKKTKRTTFNTNLLKPITKQMFLGML